MMLLSSLFAPSASYIDPAATTVLLSSISAIVIALGAAFIVFWRRAKKKVSKALNIDENANKEVEEDVVILDEPQEQENVSEKD